MGVSASTSFRGYDLDKAFQLLGPADFGELAPEGCLDYLVLMVKHVAIFVLRLFNYAFGDHQWYGNHTARHIVEQYFEAQANGDSVNEDLHARVERLYGALGVRANGNVSYAQRIYRGRPSVVQQAILPIIEDLRQGTVSQRLERHPPNEYFCCPIDALTPFEVLPPEMRVAILAELGEVSTLRLFLTTAHSYQAMKKDPLFDRKLLIDLAVKKMQKLSDELDGPSLREGGYKDMALNELVKWQVLIDPEKAAGTAAHISSSYIHDKALIKLSKERAVVNPEQAQTMASCIFSSACKAEAMYEIGRKKLLANRHSAIEWLERAMTAANGMQDLSEKEWALCWISAVQAWISPEQALDTCRLMTEEQPSYYSLQWIANAQGSRPLEQAQSDHANRTLQQILERIEAFPFNADKRDILLGMVARAQASVNKSHSAELFNQAAETLHKIQDYPIKIKEICKAAQARAPINRSEANQLCERALEMIDLDSIEPPSKVEGFCNVAKAQTVINVSLANQLFQRAIEMAGRIEDATVRFNAFLRISMAKVSALCGLAKREALENPALANEFFRQALSLANLQHATDGHKTDFFRIRMFGKTIRTMIRTSHLD